MDNAHKAISQAVESAVEDGYPVKKMYHVEKFLPPACPKCKNPFEKEVYCNEEGVRQDGDYTRLLGDIVDGKKTIRETSGYDIIICAHCRNYTARMPLETYCVGDKAFAEKLVKEQGFQNLTQVTSFGTMTNDHHAVHMQMPGMKVRDAMKED